LPTILYSLFFNPVRAGHYQTTCNEQVNQSKEKRRPH